MSVAVTVAPGCSSAIDEGDRAAARADVDDRGASSCPAIAPAPARRRSPSRAAGRARARRSAASAGGSPSRRGRRRAARGRPRRSTSARAAARSASVSGWSKLRVELEAGQAERPREEQLGVERGAVDALAVEVRRSAARSTSPSVTPLPPSSARRLRLGGQRLGEVLEVACEHLFRAGALTPTRWSVTRSCGIVVGADLLGALAACRPGPCGRPPARPPGARAPPRRGAHAAPASPSRGSAAASARPASRPRCPVGRCVIRTAESVVFTDWPPGPGGAVDVDLEVVLVDLDVDLLGLGHHGDGRRSRCGCGPATRSRGRAARDACRPRT